jgi:tripeptide aminopeptidase
MDFPRDLIRLTPPASYTIFLTMNSAEDKSWFREKILSRFLEYVKIETTSHKHSSSRPSTKGQWTLARMLQAELKELGLEEVEIDEHCFLIARIEPQAPYGEATPIGLMAHLDTTEDVSGKNVRPRIHESYDGNPIDIGEGVVLAPEDSPDLRKYEGETLVTADGRTLLGADDKAGLAEIMAAVEYLLSHPDIPRGPLEVIFTPDEETGFGMELFPRDRIRSRVCYTMDGGGEEGIVETECFEAYRLDITFQGISAHTGHARGKLINAIELGAHFIEMLPKEESPQSTDGRFGFYCPMEIKGSLESADVLLYVRDFEKAGCLRRVKSAEKAAQSLEALYPGSVVSVKSTRQYANMRESLKKHPRVVELLEEAIRAAGIEPARKSIRGGTDGARLTEMGIPTPNVFTGGYNYHSLKEWAALPAMVKAAQTIVHLARLWAENPS